MNKSDNTASREQERESFTCLFSVMDGFVYRPSTKEEAEEISESLRER